MAVHQLETSREVVADPGRKEADNKRGWLVAIGSHNGGVCEMVTTRDEVIVMMPTTEGLVLVAGQRRRWRWQLVMPQLD